MNTDTDAMDAIAEILKDAEWSPDHLEWIADIVRNTGRNLYVEYNNE
jgi:hypothetical protein